MKGPTIDILLVDDNPGDVLLTTEAFAGAQFSSRIHSVEDGQEALTFLNREGRFQDAPVPDLILLDLNMPRMSGHEVLDVLKRNERFRRIPVVVLTSSNAEADVLRSYDSHANCYICKPTHYEHYFEVVRSVEGFWLNTVLLPPRQ